MHSYLKIGIVVLLVLVSGCSESGGGGSDPTDSDAANPAEGPAGDGGDGMFGDGGSSGCQAGQSTMFASPETGERVTLEIEGIVTHEGRELCKAVWESSDPDAGFARMEMFFEAGGQYQKIVYYDAQGNEVNEIEMNGSDTGGMPGSGGMTPGGFGGMTPGGFGGMMPTTSAE